MKSKSSWEWVKFFDKRLSASWSISPTSSPSLCERSNTNRTWSLMNIQIIPAAYLLLSVYMCVFLERMQWCINTLVSQSATLYTCSCQERRGRVKNPFVKHEIGPYMSNHTPGPSHNRKTLMWICAIFHGHIWTRTHVTVQWIRTGFSSAPSLWESSSKSIISTCRAAVQRGTSWRPTACAYLCVWECVWM